MVLVGEGGGAGPARVDDNNLAAALAQRLEPAGEVGGRAQRAMRLQRVGANNQQIVGAIQVRYGDGEKGRRT